MKNEDVSRAYANALFGLAKGENIDVASELVKFNEVINTSEDLENVLFLDVFTPEEKMSVVNAVMDKLSLSSVVKHFMDFLIQEKRLPLFPMIFKDVVVLDDHAKGFLRGTIQGPDSSVDENVKNQLLDYLKKKVGKEITLDYKQNENITAGYRVTVEDLQVDASLDNQLNQLKKDILHTH
mgnify:FL=1